MSESQNSFVCTFDHKSTRISAFDIHEWIYKQLQVENAVNVVQVDGPRSQVYVNFGEIQCLQKVLHSTNGKSEYKHDNGEISQVEITMAGMGSKRVRTANLPPEISDGTVCYAFSNYGEIQAI